MSIFDTFRHPNFHVTCQKCGCRAEWADSNYDIRFREYQIAVSCHGKTDMLKVTLQQLEEDHVGRAMVYLTAFKDEPTVPDAVVLIPGQGVKQRRALSL